MNRNRQQQLVTMAYIRLLVAILKTTILVIALFAISGVNADDRLRSGTISGPDLLGNRTIQYNNGLSARLSGPDLLGAQTLRYSNGAEIRYDGPDLLGNRRITVIREPRK